MAKGMFDEADTHQIESRGIHLETIASEIEIFKRGVPYSKLNRPCTVGDGIIRLEEGDLERLKKGLEDLGIKEAEIGMNLLRKTARTLRDNFWDISATVSEIEYGCEIINIEPKDEQQKHFGLAIDIGTTTVVVSLIDLNTGEIISFLKTADMVESAADAVSSACFNP